MLTSVSQFSIDFVCTAFAGHLGALRLAAVTEAENVIICFAYGFGMGSALETLSSQAVVAEKFNMLGIYLQRSWIIALITPLEFTFLHHQY
ncbi:unnamed protein product [Coffea canephora]|uniref:Uncharacterized protein n=1 Tax=Coffea canephora TaxID=49390 RepID=A0A068TLI2_COFCA|nr:unnamed protein product [Coffea canephora]